MTFQVGHKLAPGGRRPGAGRKKGQPNKVTLQLRQFFVDITQSNQREMKAAFKKLLRVSPGEALRIHALQAEFVIPKLMRTEMTGADGGPIQTQGVTATYAAGDPQEAVRAYQAFLESGDPLPQQPAPGGKKRGRK